MTYIAELHFHAAATRGPVIAELVFRSNSDKSPTARSGLVSRLDLEVCDSKNIPSEFQDQQSSQTQQLTAAFSVKAQM